MNWICALFSTTSVYTACTIRISCKETITICCHLHAGITMATVLANAGLTTFDKLLAMNARDLELVR